MKAAAEAAVPLLPPLPASHGRVHMKVFRKLIPLTAIVVCINHIVLPVAGFCKQQLWPLFHYSLPFSPSSLGRFDSELWQAYVKANKVILHSKLMYHPQKLLPAQAGGFRC